MDGLHCIPFFSGVWGLFSRIILECLDGLYVRLQETKIHIFFILFNFLICLVFFLKMPGLMAHGWRIFDYFVGKKKIGLQSCQTDLSHAWSILGTSSGKLFRFGSS